MKTAIIAGWFGGWEVLILLLIILILFGGRKLPELMKGMGQGMKEFKKATGDEDDSSADDSSASNSSADNSIANKEEKDGNTGANPSNEKEKH